eukprot:2797659-Prymnesium_polylepis.2
MKAPPSPGSLDNRNGRLKASEHACSLINPADHVFPANMSASRPGVACSQQRTCAHSCDTRSHARHTAAVVRAATCRCGSTANVTPEAAAPRLPPNVVRADNARSGRAPTHP